MALPDTSLGSLLARPQDQELGPELSPQVDEPYQSLLAAMLKRDPARRPAMSSQQAIARQL